MSWNSYHKWSKFGFWMYYLLLLGSFLPSSFVVGGDGTKQGGRVGMTCDDGWTLWSEIKTTEEDFRKIGNSTSSGFLL